MKRNSQKYNVITGFENKNKIILQICDIITNRHALEKTADELLRDSLRCFHVIANHNVGSCFPDCSFYEIRIIRDVMEELRSRRCVQIKNIFK